MKRLIAIIIIAMSCMAVHAQIVSAVKDTNAFNTLCRFRASSCSIREYNNDVYMSLKSSNQFDDSAIIELGDGIDKARRTLYDLADLIGSMKKNTSAVFSTTVKGEIYTYTIFAVWENHVRFIDLEGIAGDVYVDRQELISVADRLLKKSGVKIIRRPNF